jgi:hypothetical protein
MVHKSSLIPGISRFIDENILSHYPTNSMKRILMAGAVSLYLKQNEGIVDTVANNPLVTGLGLVHENGMLDIDQFRDTIKCEINKVGFMRLSLPMIGDIDFTTEDVDALYKFIIEANTQLTSVPVPNSTLVNNNGGVY